MSRHGPHRLPTDSRDPPVGGLPADGSCDRLVGDENFMMRDREARIEGRLGERTSVLRHDGGCVYSSTGIGPGNTFNASSSGVTGFGVLQNRRLSASATATSWH